MYSLIIKRINSKENLLVFAVFFLYIALRLLVWQFTFLPLDTDSVGYLLDTRAYLTFNLNTISELAPESTPFYPFFSALCSLPGFSVEIGARLCSFIFSVLLFIAVLGIGKEITTIQNTTIGLLILSLSPILAFLSVDIFTEPSYIALVYLGLWVFISQYKNPKNWKTALIGAIFGLSYINRTEGILFVGIIPFLYFTRYVFSKVKNFGFKKDIIWSLIFIVGFSAVAIPQIWSVSSKMGRLAINGRQTWIAIFKYPDGKSWDQKLRGLDYSLEQTNLEYLQSHPEAARRIQIKFNFAALSKLFGSTLKQFSILYQERIGALIGPIGVVFFIYGLFFIIESKKYYIAWLILFFIGANLVAPLIHNVAMRHIAVIGPLIMLVEGIGVYKISQNLLKVKNFGRYAKIIVLLLLTLHLIGTSATPILMKFYTYKMKIIPRNIAKNEHTNFIKPAKIIKQIAEEERDSLVKVAGRKNYLAYYATAKHIRLPYANYKDLVAYCNLKDVDFVFLRYSLLTNSYVKYPFIVNFQNHDTTNEFRLVYRGQDNMENVIELYHVIKK